MTEKIQTDLSVSPYFDDFNEEKNFHRVLYRPGTAVQARELNQMQTILQNQVGRHGNFTFKEGAVVKGSSTFFSQNMLGFVRVDDTFINLGNTTNVSVNNNIKILYTSNHSVNAATVTIDGSDTGVYNANQAGTGAFIVGGTTSVIKKLWFYKDGLESQFPDTNILYTIEISQGGNDGNNVIHTDFAKDEILYAFANQVSAAAFRSAVLQGNTAADVANSAFASIRVYNDPTDSNKFATGAAMGMVCTDGIVFAKEHFVRYDSQKTIVYPYGFGQDWDSTGVNAALFPNGAPYESSKYVGFEIAEETITPEIDNSLFDNATGSPNENAPGAHRLKLTANLKTFDGQPSNNFSQLAGINVTYDPHWAEKIRVDGASANEDGMKLGGPYRIRKINNNDVPDLNENGLGRVFAKALQDTAGDYVIGRPKLKFKAHSSNTDLANCVIDFAPGGSTFFNKGLRYNSSGFYSVDLRRGIDTIEEENVIASMNYGNYVVVNELSGTFPFDKLSKAFLVANNFSNISRGYNDGYGYSSLLSGLSDVLQDPYDPATGSDQVIGNCNILNVVHESGDMGLPNGQFRVYVSDVKLAAGYKFSNVYGMAFEDPSNRGVVNAAIGSADVISTSLQETDRTTLVFPTGRNAVKTFFIGDTETDTEYTARDRQSGTLGTDGVISITRKTSTGSTNQPAQQGNPLGDTLEKEFLVVATANGTSSANATSFGATPDGSTTVSLTSANNTIRPGMLISHANSTVETVALVESANSSAYVTNVAIGATQTDVQLKIVNGQLLNLTGGTANIAANATVMTINTGIGTFGGNTTHVLSGTVAVDVIYNLKRNEITSPLKKDIKKNVYVTIDTSTNPSGTSGPWNLGLADIHRIRNVFIGGSGDSYATILSTANDVTSSFLLNNGQTDMLYKHGSLQRALGSTLSISSGDKLVVKLDTFTANNSSGSGFYNIDSYPIDDLTSSANNDGIATREVPIFSSLARAKKIDLRDAIDFRPRITNTANSDATVIGSATENPANSDVIDLIGNESLIAHVGTNFEADLTYYLGRADMLVFTADGGFVIREGKPTNNYRQAAAPKEGAGEMPLAIITVPPFPSILDDERITPEIPNTKRREFKVLHKMVTNRRYTMKDIGQLARRIENLETYVSLNLLEKSAADTSIKDAAGLDRFKNGIFVDPMQSLFFTDVSKENGIFSAAIDVNKLHLRPAFRQNDIQLKFNAAESSGVQQFGNFVMRPLDTGQGNNGHVAYRSTSLANGQFVATKTRNLADPVFEYHGRMTLLPRYDVRAEHDPNIAKGEVNIDIDISAPFEELAAQLDGTEFGGWETISSTGISSSVIGSSTSGNWTTTTILNQETLTQQTDVFNITAQPGEVTETTVNNIIQDLKFQPYVREQVIGFVVTSLKPNSRLRFQFDGVEVDEHVSSGYFNPDLFPSINPATSTYVFDGTVDQTVSAVRPTEGADPALRNTIIPNSARGINLFSDENGVFIGTLKIPGETFLQGEKLFEIVEFHIRESSQSYYAGQTFLASSILYQSTDLNFTTIQPELDITITQATQQVTNSWTSTTQTFNPPPAADDGGGGGDADNGGGGGDGPCAPIAQTFTIHQSDLGAAGDPGIFMTRLTLFFSTKDPVFGMDIGIYDVSGGQQVPVATSRIPGSFVPKTPDQVVTAGNENGPVNPTHFDFVRPVFLKADTTYAFIVHPEAGNDGYNLWMARIGGFDALSNGTAQVNDFAGTGIAYFSKNARNWNAMQDEFVTYEMRRAAFQHGTGTAILENDDDEFITTGTYSLDDANKPVEPGDYVQSTSNTDARGVVDLVNALSGNLIIGESLGGFSASDTINFYRVNTAGGTLIDTNGNVTANIHAANLLASGVSLIGNTTISSINNIDAHAMVLQLNPMELPRTSITHSYRGMSNNYNTQASIAMPLDDTVEFARIFDSNENATRIIASKSNEMDNAPGNAKSTRISSALECRSSGVSPFLDLSRRNMLVVTNRINNDNTNEHTNDGNAISRYISRTVQLADGNDAEDIKVFVTAYKPPLTDIDVYVKLLSPNDPDIFQNKVWTKLNQVTLSTLFSDDEFDVKEYEYTMPTAAPVTNAAFVAPEDQTDELEDLVIAYTGADNVVYQRFKYFAVKLVMRSQAPEIVPYIKDLRAIALQL